MLNITTNQAGANISSAAYCGYGIVDEAAAAAELFFDDEMMDPLFEEDWLHENNLDILFDLFEEEIESKVGVETNSASSSMFGTSPVKSYLFGTSPTLASALDLIYFDNQQPSMSSGRGNVTECSATNATTSGLHATCNLDATTPASMGAFAATTIGHHAMNATNHTVASGNRSKQSTYNNIKGTQIVPNTNVNAQQVNTSQTLTSSITNAMRIKRGFKKGQSEGVSLLAKPKPCLSNSGKTNGNNGVIGGNNGSSKSNGKSNNRRVNATPTSKNISDKTSAKITNFKSSIIIGNTSNNKNTENDRNSIDINYSKQSQHQSRDKYYIHKCQQHVHYITGRAVILEHAYAVRGH